MSEDDARLMERLAAGDREVLDLIMERHYRRLYRLCLRYLRNVDDALDAVQETFVKAFRGAGSWRAPATVAAWLNRIAINHCIDRYRRARRRKEHETVLPEDDHTRDLAAPQISAERQVMGREIRERIDRALSALPERQRAVFVLRHYEELSLEEISEALDMKLGSVKSSLHRALHNLRRRLAGADI